MATVAARVSGRRQGTGFHRRQSREGAANVICAFWLEGGAVDTRVSSCTQNQNQWPHRGLNNSKPPSQEPGRGLPTTAVLSRIHPRCLVERMDLNILMVLKQFKTKFANIGFLESACVVRTANTCTRGPMAMGFKCSRS